MKDFPEVKTFKSIQHFCRNSIFIIMDYLPCPCSITAEVYEHDEAGLEPNVLDFGKWPTI